MKYLIKGLLNRLGYDINKYPNPDLRRRMELIQKYSITRLLDVGANVGQYSSFMREIGYNGNIVSFEPLKSAYVKLAEASKTDSKWEIHNYGLGDLEDKFEINVSKKSVCSSLLDMTSEMKGTYQGFKYIGKEIIEVKTLDQVFNEISNINDNILLKIDTQGYEKLILEGAKDTLDKICLLQLELSVVELYKEELLLTDMLSFLESKNFKLVSIETGMQHPKTAHLMQLDGLFVNRAMEINPEL